MPGSTSTVSISSARRTIATRRSCSSPVARDGSPVGWVIDDPAQDAVRPHHLGDRRKCGDEHGRYALSFELLRQRCPATRSCASGAGEDHRAHLRPLGDRPRSPGRNARRSRSACRPRSSCRRRRAARPNACSRSSARAASSGTRRFGICVGERRVEPGVHRLVGVGARGSRRRRSGSAATRSRGGWAGGRGCPAARSPPRSRARSSSSSGRRRARVAGLGRPRGSTSVRTSPASFASSRSTSAPRAGAVGQDVRTEPRGR